MWVNLVGRGGPLYFEPNFLPQLQIVVFGLHAYDVSLFGELERPFHPDAMEVCRRVEDACAYQWNRVSIVARARVFPNTHRVLSARGVGFDGLVGLVQFGIDLCFVHWRQAAIDAGGAQRDTPKHLGHVICVGLHGCLAVWLSGCQAVGLLSGWY